jgi:hypothetical protein
MLQEIPSALSVCQVGLAAEVVLIEAGGEGVCVSKHKQNRANSASLSLSEAPTY